MSTKAGNSQGVRQKPKPFRWLGLPNELKNLVYGHCLTDIIHIHIRTRKQGVKDVLERIYPRPYKPSGKLNTNLLVVDRKIYAEGAPILYQNDLRFEDARALYLFLRSLDPRRKAALRHLTLKNYASRASIMPAFDSLLGATSLRMLAIELFPRSFEPDAAAREIYLRAQHWIEAVGEARRNRYAAMRILRLSDYAACSLVEDSVIYSTAELAKQVGLARKAFFDALKSRL